MDKNENCTASKLKLDKDNYKEDRTVCKSGYNEKKTKNNENFFSGNESTAFHQNQNSKMSILTITIEFSSSRQNLSNEL